MQLRAISNTHLHFLCFQINFIQSKMAAIDWDEINAKLPFERTDEDKAKRRELFKQFDPNENGYLSLAEVSYK